MSSTNVDNLCVALNSFIKSELLQTPVMQSVIYHTVRRWLRALVFYSLTFFDTQILISQTSDRHPPKVYQRFGAKQDS